MKKHRKGRVKLKNIELLAPVGSEESLYAAVENGADAVYLGGELYSARKHANNFSKEELIETVKYAHLNGVEVDVAVNILLEDKEVEEALDYVKFLYEIDVDGIIIQDIGLASLIREIFPDLALHASTQMTINNLEGAKHLENMGFTRVVLARETPLEEIENIVKNTSLEVEVFVHGALCVAYSGQCLMSSFIGGRSGNRGSCAQPCRMAYSIVDEKGRLVKDWEDRYVLSSRDLNTIESINRLLDIGVDSLKIEGRMKRPEYVATIVDKYRKAIDNGVDSISEDDKKDIEQIFNRNFTKGLTFEDFGNSFIAYDRPDNRGIYLGKVIGIRGNLVHVELEEDLNLEDGIEFRLANGENKGMASDRAGKKGEVIILKKIGDIEVGSKLYKTSDSQLLKRARQSFEDRPGKKVDMKFEAFIGNRPNLILSYGDIDIEVENEFVVENAKRVPLDHKSIERQLSKLGDSYYELGELFTDIEEGSFLPVSIINELRRDAVEKLEEVLFETKRPVVEDYESLKKEALLINREKSLSKNLISVKIEEVEQFRALDLDKLDRIYIGCLEDLDEIIAELDKNEIEKYIWTDKILETANLGHIKLILDEYKDRIDGVSVSNIGSLNLVRENFPDLKIHGDTGLNIFNSYTGSYYRNIGLTSMTLSEELTLEQVNKIASRLGGELEIVSYGYLQSMIMKTCPMALIKGCGYNEDCDKCNFRRGYGLRDRMDKVFRFVRKNDQTTLYNSVLLMTLDSIDEIGSRNNFYLKLNYTLEEDPQEIRDVHSYFYDYINDEIGKREMIDFVSRFSEAKELTKGHFFRGIL